MRVTAHVPEKRRAHAPAGYTLAELIVVMLIGGVLLAVTASGFRTEATRQRAEGARNAYAGMLRRARTLAVQRGAQVNLSLSPSQGVATIATPGGTVLDKAALADEFRLDHMVTPSDSDFSVCFGSRGFAVSCGSSLPATVSFVVGGDTTQVHVQALGQTDIQ